MAEDLTRWEYKYWSPKIRDSQGEQEKDLNDMGKQGWEVVGTHQGIILKRPLPKQPQRNAPPYNPPYNGR